MPVGGYVCERCHHYVTAMRQTDPITHAVIAAKMFQHTLDAVPLQQQARIDMKDLLDVMIQQIRGEL